MRGAVGVDPGEFAPLGGARVCWGIGISSRCERHALGSAPRAIRSRSPSGPKASSAVGCSSERAWTASRSPPTTRTVCSPSPSPSPKRPSPARSRSPTQEAWLKPSRHQFSPSDEPVPGPRSGSHREPLRGMRRRYRLADSRTNRPSTDCNELQPIDRRSVPGVNTATVRPSSPRS